ncbi:hypothetical protein KFE25_000152 [Diacronema lutheri]|uniref:Cyanate hydratase n=1 Tax=Diacronema lutheri TaxID=2081491 RepID=A0A8J5XNU9_DIALT|nr:hypothetical protein KFE25_000152 [Diacronema lutheri]
MLRASVVGRRAASTLALAARTERLLAAKAASGKSFDQLASDLGTTNTYAAQLLLGQAKLTDATASKLKEALPGLDDADLRSMGTCPDRSYDPFVFQDPVAYRLKEAVCHNARSIKMIINEQCGDGIMSAIDMYLDVGTVKGRQGERRVVVTMNGKFLPFVEQRAEDNSCPAPHE